MTIDDRLSAVKAAAIECFTAADALESTNLDSLNNALAIALYEPNRFESHDEYSEARIARDAAVAAQNAANRLKEVAMPLAVALKSSGYDLSAAEFAEAASKAIKSDWSLIHDHAPALRDAASRAQSAIGEYYKELGQYYEGL